MPLPTISKSALRQVIEASHPVANILTMESGTAENSSIHIGNLLMTMQETEFSAPFDWHEEYSNNKEHLENLEVIKNADLEEIRKIMTAHIRIDRMSDGHLHSLIETGYWNACLTRITDLHAQMQDDE